MPPAPEFLAADQRVQAWSHAYLVTGTASIPEAQEVLGTLIGRERAVGWRTGMRPLYFQDSPAVAFYFRMGGL